MEFLLLLKVGVVLGETLESELVREPDVVGVGNVFLLEFPNLLGVRGRVHHDLLLSGHQIDDFLDINFEVQGK